MFEHPLPYRPLLGMQLRLHKTRNDAIARTQDVVTDGSLERQLLASLLALDKEAEFLR